MRKSCWVCAKTYNDEFRGWYEHLIPRVCSGPCFNRWVNEAHLPIEIHSRDSRIAVFRYSPEGLRSTYEHRFREYLFEHRASMSCAYEPLVFTFKDKSRYVPDFLVSTRVFVEVKGLWTSEAKKKVLAFQEQFSEFPLVVLDNKALTRITKKQR